MISCIKTKQDLVKALACKELKFVSKFEVVNEIGLKAVSDKSKSLLRSKKKLHVVLLERT